MVADIKRVCCYDAAIADIFNSFSPGYVYVRGIASTLGGEIVLPGFTEVGNDAVVGSIADVIDNGTELKIVGGRLVDRPEDVTPYGFVTRVAGFRFGNEMNLMYVRNALSHVEQLGIEGLIPTLLVYDSERVVFLGGVSIALPLDLKERRESLLMTYLIDNVICRSEEI